MDSIESADLSPIDFHTAMETPCKDVEESPLLPRTSTPYAWSKKRPISKPSPVEAEPRALFGTVSSKTFLAVILVLQLVLLAVVSQIVLADAHRELSNTRSAKNFYSRKAAQEFSMVLLVIVPVVLFALVALKIGSFFLLLPFFLFQFVSNFIVTFALGNVIRTHWTDLFSRTELVIPTAVALFVPYFAWAYITYVTLRQLFAIHHSKKLRKLEAKNQRDVERPTTDDEDIIVFERPGQGRKERKVRFCDLLKKKY